MKNSRSIYRCFKNVIIFIVSLMIVIMWSIFPHGSFFTNNIAFAAEDEITVTASIKPINSVTTDKVALTVSLKNTNAMQLSGIQMRIIYPEEFNIVEKKDCDFFGGGVSFFGEDGANPMYCFFGSHGTDGKPSEYTTRKSGDLVTLIFEPKNKLDVNKTYTFSIESGDTLEAFVLATLVTDELVYTNTDYINVTYASGEVKYKSSNTGSAGGSAGGSSGGGGGGGGAPAAPAEKPSAEPTQSGNTTTTDMSGSTVSKGGQTTTTVDKQAADKLVETAVANKSEEIVISAVTKNQSAASGTKSSEVALPADTLQTIAEKTNADIVIKTNVAEVKLDNKAAEAVASQAQTGTAGKNETVSIVAEKVKEEAKEVRIELKVVTSGGAVISDFKGGNATVTVNVPKSLSNKKIVCVYIDENGHMHKMDGGLNSDGTYSFTTGHFSTYAIMSEEEADAAIKEQKAAVKSVKLKLRSQLVKTKSGKKAIKLTWTNPSNIEFEGVEIYRSVKKNSGYGKKPIGTSKTGKYINTSVKSGKKYYYKVRGFVTIDGEKVYTAWSTKAYRTMK